MFPGLTTKLSRDLVASTTTINAMADLIRITGTEAIATINPNFGGGFSGVIILEPAAAYTLVTTGNIAIASTATAGRAMIMVYDHVTAKWYPSY
jgi:hypothetical protein